MNTSTLTATATSATASFFSTLPSNTISSVCYTAYDPDLIATVEKDNKKTYVYNVAGIKIKCKKIFENKTKTTKLYFYGDADIFGVERKFEKDIIIDTDIYNKYDWNVSNGILYVVLFEKLNDAPEFERVGKSKKPAKEEVCE